MIGWFIWCHFDVLVFTTTVFVVSSGKSEERVSEDLESWEKFSDKIDNNTATDHEYVNVYRISSWKQIAGHNDHISIKCWNQ